MFQFTSVRTLTLERIAFINCGIQLLSINDTRITNCTFEKNAILLVSSNNTRIRSCLFHSSSADSAIGYRYVMLFIKSTGNVIIENCTFQNNRARNVIDQQAMLPSQIAHFRTTVLLIGKEVVLYGWQNSAV